MIKRNKYLIVVLLIVLLTALGFSKFYSQNHLQHATGPGSQNTQAAKLEAAAGIPQKVYTVLKYVETHQGPMEGYVGGREFMNREKLLPLSTPDHKPVHYREWDVNPKIKGRNRGSERLVTGSDHSAWYTANHYKSFLKIK